MKKSIIVLLCLVFLISCWETSIEVNDDWAKVNVPWAKIEVNDDWAEVNINPAEIIEVVEKLEDFGENNNETITEEELEFWNRIDISPTFMFEEYGIDDEFSYDVKTQRSVT